MFYNLFSTKTLTKSIKRKSVVTVSLPLISIYCFWLYAFFHAQCFIVYFISQFICDILDDMDNTVYFLPIFSNSIVTHFQHTELNTVNVLKINKFIWYLNVK